MIELYDKQQEVLKILLNDFINDFDDNSTIKDAIDYLEEVIRDNKI